MDINELRYRVENDGKSGIDLEEIHELLEAAEKERDTLCAKIEQMQRQEPVAWRTYDGEGGYDYRSYEGNENYKLGWDARHPDHIGWVEPLYALPGAQAQPAPSCIKAASMPKTKKITKNIF